jgi:hypothetical protein
MLSKSDVVVRCEKNYKKKTNVSMDYSYDSHNIDAKEKRHGEIHTRYSLVPHTISLITADWTIRNALIIDQVSLKQRHAIYEETRDQSNDMDPWIKDAIH